MSEKSDEESVEYIYESDADEDHQEDETLIEIDNSTTPITMKGLVDQEKLFNTDEVMIFSSLQSLISPFVGWKH
jgi:hypothetical protein